MRKTTRKDILLLWHSGFTVFLLGLIVSGRDGYDGLAGAIWDLIHHPENAHLLSAWSIVENVPAEVPGRLYGKCRIN